MRNVLQCVTISFCLVSKARFVIAAKIAECYSLQWSEQLKHPLAYCLYLVVNDFHVISCLALCEHAMLL